MAVLAEDQKKDVGKYAKRLIEFIKGEDLSPDKFPSLLDFGEEPKHSLQEEPQYSLQELLEAMSAPFHLETDSPSSPEDVLEALNSWDGTYGNKLSRMQISKEVIATLRKRTEASNAQACFVLAYLLEKGIGVEADTAESQKLYRTAFELYLRDAEAEDALALYFVGHCHEWGRGVEKSTIREAIKWYQKSAERGNVIGQFMAGQRGISMLPLRNSPARTKSLKESLAWIRKAAEQGHVRAQFELGQNYRIGRGVKKDDVAAAQWYRKASEQGLAIAQIRLGECYQLGKGVETDLMQAIYWFNSAAFHGKDFGMENFTRYLQEKGASVR